MTKLTTAELKNAAGIGPLLKAAERKGFKRRYRAGVADSIGAVVKLSEDALPSENPEMPFSNSIDELDLTVRSWNCLKGEGIETVEDLLGYSAAELMDIRNFGLGSLSDVRYRLAHYGYTLMGDPSLRKEGA